MIRKNADSFDGLQPLSVSYEDQTGADRVKDYLLNCLDLFQDNNIIVLCIGTDRATGDALGPLVGSKLSLLNVVPVFGTLEEPVHAVNLADTVQHIRRNYPDCCIIAVDACLGQLKSIGSINVGCGSLKPGAGVKKNLPEVGDIYVTGIVNIGGFMEYFVLQNTRLGLVVKMAEFISSSLGEALLAHKKKRPLYRIRFSEQLS
jgi:putative sporulation protein YyaC